jgi:hypothetical protein
VEKNWKPSVSEIKDSGKINTIPITKLTKIQPLEIPELRN